MPFKIVRNDITKMTTEAIVNTANCMPAVGHGCDTAVYKAAGYEELLAWRRKYVGSAKVGEAFITPGFRLPAKYIIHTVSPRFIDGKHGEEELLRSCYRRSLALAAGYGIRSIAFPLIATGSFGYPKEEGMRIAVDEIHAFLLRSDMQIFLVVFDENATRMGRSLYPDLEAYIDRNYVQERRAEEYGTSGYLRAEGREARPQGYSVSLKASKRRDAWENNVIPELRRPEPEDLEGETLLLRSDRGKQFPHLIAALDQLDERGVHYETAIAERARELAPRILSFGGIAILPEYLKSEVPGIVSRLYDDGIAIHVRLAWKGTLPPRVMKLLSAYQKRADEQNER